MEYNNYAPINRDKAEIIFSSGSRAEICEALVSVVLYDPDWKWCQEQSLRLLEASDVEVSGLAATCLGHIARIHHKLDLALVIPALKKHLNNPDISGRVEDAINDIEMFMSKGI